MNKYSDHDYANSQLLDCGVDKLETLEQNFDDFMTQYRLDGIYNVHNTRSSDS